MDKLLPGEGDVVARSMQVPEQPIQGRRLGRLLLQRQPLEDLCARGGSGF